MNINNTLEVVALGAALGQSFKSASADGTINSADLSQLITVIPHVAPAIAGISEVPKELDDLDDAEAKIITDKVVEIVGEASTEKAARIARASLKLGLNTWDLIQEIRSDDAA